MRFELSVEPDAVARLKGLPIVSRAAGRTRKHRIIWHDSPDRVLAAAGLALAEERGTWRLERLCPALPDGKAPNGKPDAGAATDRLADGDAADGNATGEKLKGNKPANGKAGNAAHAAVPTDEKSASRKPANGKAGQWPPAGPAPVMAENADPSRLGHALPDTLAPAAACEGLVSDHCLETLHGPVEVTRLRGVLRSVAAERPVARLTLAGSEAAILSGARLLSAATAASVPRASLAAEALAAADGKLPHPRHLGPPLLPAHGTVGDAFAHALGHLTDVILHHAPAAADTSYGPEAIHQMRVAVRRLRSAMTVFRPVIGPATTQSGETSESTPSSDAGPQAAVPPDPMSRMAIDLKVLAQTLGPAREWDVFVTETAPAVAAAMGSDKRLERLLQAARRRRAEARISLSSYLRGNDFRQLGIELAWLSGTRGWEVPEDADDAGSPRDEPRHDLLRFATKALQRRYKKLRAAGKDIEGLDIPALHDLRLRAKRMRYTAEIMAPLFPPKPTRRFIEKLARLQARLGVLNDGAVARSLMDELGGPAGRHAHAVGLVLGFTAGDASQSRSLIFRSWEKLQHQAAFWT